MLRRQLKFDENTTSQDRWIAEIIAERKYQDSLWGTRQTHSQDRWNTIVGEEHGEICKATLREDLERYKSELVQLAATALAILENIDSNPENFAQ